MKHGDSHLPEQFRPRVPVAGTIKIGSIEQKAGKALPKKLDYMRFCGPSATAGGQYPDRADMAAENKAHSSSCTIELVSDEAEVNLEVAYVMAGRGHVLCRGNGTKAERRLDAKGVLSPDQPFKALEDGACGAACPFFSLGKCKLASTLRFRIPGKTDLGSVWQFRTTSWNSAQDLLGAMGAIKALTGGILARIPLRLFMTEQRRNPLTDGGRTSSAFWTLGLSFEGTEQDLIEAVRKARETKAKMDALNIPTLEARLATQGNELLDKDLSAAEELAVAAEFFSQNGATKATEPIPESADAEEGAATLEASAESVLREPVELAAAQSDVLESADASHTDPQPSSTAEAKIPGLLTLNQAGLIRRHAGRVKALDLAALDSRLATMTKVEATGFISKMLTNAQEAFASLGVVAA